MNRRMQRHTQVAREQAAGLDSTLEMELCLLLLHGILHIASLPITKFDLLKLIAKHYDKDIAIIADDTVTIDRSLDSSHFNALTGYHSPEWNDLVMRMHDFG